MCAVHGPGTGCKCGYARSRQAGMSLAVAVAVLTSCAALASVTPADRAAGYKAHAKGHTYACKAYAWDQQQGLVDEVPEMARVCQ